MTTPPAPGPATTEAAAATAAPADLPLNGQVIGQAERATRAVLDVVLADTGISFNEWVALNLVGTNAVATVDALVGRLTAGLRIDRTTAFAAIEDARSRGLLEGTDELELTVTGRARFQAITDAITGIADRVYGDLSHADLVIARRVLETVTRRAEAELAV
jgi:hypothetical protein